MKNKKAQISVEYLLIIGMAMAILIPGTIMFYNYSKDSNDQLVSNQINRIGKNIIHNSEDMYVIGKDSWTTIDVNMPESATGAYIIENELIIMYSTRRGITESVFFSDVPIVGLYSGNISESFHSGAMKIKIESKGDHIVIGEYNP
jgi:uncharacterized protein (UPF0333 family)